MESLPKHIRASELYGDHWFNSEPVSVHGMQGNVILVDFWDYTSLPSLSAIPYVKAWEEKYREYGLIVIGVHTPEFRFGKDPENVRAALKELDLAYPVVCDNDARIWSSFGNRSWPTKYLIDKDGFIRYVHQGEGSYEQFERAIQYLLAEAGIHGDMPELMEPVRESDAPGAVCYKTTGEIQAGYLRGALGNPEGYGPESTLEYADPGLYLPGRFYVKGKWLSEREFIRFNGDSGDEGHISLYYEATEVNAVLNSESGKPCKVLVQQDGGWLRNENRGQDILAGSDGSTYVMVDRAKMFNLIRNQGFGEHVVRLVTDSPGFELYSFSFTTSVIPEVISKN